MKKKWYGVNSIGNLKIIEAVRETEQYIITNKGDKFKKKSDRWHTDPFYYNYFTKQQAIELLEQMKKASNLIFDTSLEELEND